MSTADSSDAAAAFGGCLFMLGVLALAVTLSVLHFGLVGGIIAAAIVLILFGLLFLWISA